MANPSTSISTLRFAAVAALMALAVGCADASETAETDAAARDAGPWLGPPAATTRDFLVTSISFAVPEGIKAQKEAVANPCGLNAMTNNTTYKPLILQGQAVNGFDLDGADNQADGKCKHSDYKGPNGETGIDYAFLHAMDMIRPLRPGQSAETVLRSAPSQGLIRIGIRMSGVDDVDNDDDDDVQVLLVTTAEAPLQGADGEILAGSSVAVDPDPAFRSVLPGRIVDGVLLAGPGDVKMGKINLLVAQNRIIELKDVRIRAKLTPRETGGFSVDARIAGWWQRDSMVEAIGQAILTIGANAGELKCVLDKHCDHSLSGDKCDAMSTMLHAKAISGFITGLPENAGGK